MNARNKVIEEIYQYNSFVQFFKDWVREEQASNPELSIGKLAALMDLSNTAAVSNILKGRRVPNEQTMLKFRRLVKLTPIEIQYIELICEKDRQKDNKLVTSALELSIQKFLNSQNLEQIHM